MTDYTELKRLAEDAIQHSEKIGEHDWYHENEVRSLLLSSTEDAQFVSNARPEVVLALIAERDRLKAENDSVRKHWQNESNNVQALMAEVLRLKAENERLEGALEFKKIDAKTYREASERFQAENEALRKLLLDASEEIYAWGSYASDYFQEKHDLEGCVEKFHAAALSKGEQP
ncbi:hypothetical protein PEQA60_22090 [Pseudomonas sp. Eqa60]|uniref:hypothetical protein n=1 Tax=Pseudomonas sp. Eqa60 TaxID=2799184 RepID=UPI001BB36B3B|nr:hypothetical protein [Pseudomonas sp. Eqa60]BCQ68219.1 hypothetical protein PEQA60_22090 [Pseudomonas sp. Eqa60]